MTSFETTATELECVNEWNEKRRPDEALHVKTTRLTQLIY